MTTSIGLVDTLGYLICRFDVPNNCKYISFRGVQGFDDAIYTIIVNCDGIDVQHNTSFSNFCFFELRWHCISEIEKLESLTHFKISNVLPKFFRPSILHALMLRNAKIDVPPSVWPSSLLLQYKWKQTHALLLDVFFGLYALHLPLYVQMWICDFLPIVSHVQEKLKIGLLESAQRSARRWLELRNTVFASVYKRRRAKKIN